MSGWHQWQPSEISSLQFHPAYEKILILTSPICGLNIPREATINCLAGKFDWIKENLSQYFLRQFSMSPVKDFCAMENSLLIDDSDENVNKFERAGGQAILMPRPWNSAHGHNPIPYIETKLRKISRF